MYKCFFPLFFKMPRIAKIIKNSLPMTIYICSAQRKNWYNSGIVLRKVGILTLSANSGIVPDNSRIAQGIYVENR